MKLLSMLALLFSAQAFSQTPTMKIDRLDTGYQWTQSSEGALVLAIDTYWSAEQSRFVQTKKYFWLKGEVQIDKNGNIPTAEIELIPFVGGTFNEGTGKFAFLPVNLSKDLRLGQNRTLSISLVGVYFNSDENLSEKNAAFFNAAVTALTYTQVDEQNYGKSSHLDILGSMKIEVGFKFDLSSNIGMKLTLFGFDVRSGQGDRSYIHPTTSMNENVQAFTQRMYTRIDAEIRNTNLTLFAEYGIRDLGFLKGTGDFVTYCNDPYTSHYWWWNCETSEKSEKINDSIYHYLKVGLSYKF